MPSVLGTNVGPVCFCSSVARVEASAEEQQRSVLIRAAFVSGTDSLADNLAKLRNRVEIIGWLCWHLRTCCIRNSGRGYAVL